MNFKSTHWTLVATIMIFCSLARANFVYEGNLADGAGNAIASATMSLRLQILDPSGTCAIYEETDPSITTSTSGFFSVTVGSGSVTGGFPAPTVKAAFANNSAILSGLTYLSGTACNYTPALGDARQLAVFVTVPGTPEDGLGKIVINQSESSVYADEALSIAGINSSTLLVANSSTANLTQATLNNVFSNSNYVVLTNLIANGSGGYVSAATNGTVNVPRQNIISTGGLTTGEMWYDPTSNGLKYYNGTSIQSVGTGSATGTVTNVGTGVGLLGGPISSSGTLSVNVGMSAGQILQLDASAKIPPVDGSQLMNLLATQITSGILPLVRGGTGAVLAPAGKGEIVYSNNASSFITLAAGSAGQVLTTFGPGVSPSWMTPVDPTKIPMTGGSMTGLLILSGDPSSALGASTKQYVDTSVAATGSTYLAKSGGAMTGALVNNTNSSSTAFALTQSGIGSAASFMGGNVGIGTATPTFILDVGGVINARSHYANIGGPVPTLGTCTNGALVAGSTDTRGGVVFSGTGSTCAINFNLAYSSGNPFCVVSMTTTGAVPSTYISVSAASATSFAVSFAGATPIATQGFSYHCMQ